MTTTEQKFIIPAIDLIFRSADEARAAGEAFRATIQALGRHADVHVKTAPEIRYDQIGFRAFTEFGVTAPVAESARVIMVLGSEVTVSTPAPPLEAPEATHVMIDLETLGRKAGCPVLSIGAVVMTPTGVVDRFYTNLEVDPQVARGLAIDPDTEAWWARQGAEARAALTTERKAPEIALAAFAEWVGTHASISKRRVWGNGSDFDNTILLELYSVFGIKAPWLYYNGRCYRTLKNLHRRIVAAEFVGTRHDALADAAHQAEHAIRILNATNGWATV